MLMCFSVTKIGRKFFPNDTEKYRVKKVDLDLKNVWTLRLLKIKTQNPTMLL